MMTTYHKLGSNCDHEATTDDTTTRSSFKAALSLEDSGSREAEVRMFFAVRNRRRTRTTGLATIGHTGGIRRQSMIE